jgi:hypothetical protein
MLGGQVRMRAQAEREQLQEITDQTEDGARQHRRTDSPRSCRIRRVREFAVPPWAVRPDRVRKGLLRSTAAINPLEDEKPRKDLFAGDDLHMTPKGVRALDRVRAPLRRHEPGSVVAEPEASPYCSDLSTCSNCFAMKVCPRFVG